MQAVHVDVAILGGGFTGAMVAAQLLRHSPGPLALAVVERRAEIGRGVAYSTDDVCHLLNVPAGSMSAWPDEPGHFLAWLKAQPGFEAAGATTFAPRRMFGRYVTEVLTAAEALAAPGVTLSRVQDEAVGLRLTAEGAEIDLASLQTLSARRVVLAIGHFPPADPAVPGSQAFYRSARYVAEPWTPEALSAIGPDEDVLLIGAGLTAIDLALSLEARGHRGRLHLLSRNGRLPQVHVPGLAPRAATPPPAPHTALGLLAWVRNEVADAEARGLDWRQAIDGLRPHLQGLWGGLSHGERRRFLRHARPLWEVHRHRMAPEVAGAIARLQANGQLTLHAGRLTGYEESPTGVLVHVRRRPLAPQASLTVPICPATVGAAASVPPFGKGEDGMSAIGIAGLVGGTEAAAPNEPGRIGNPASLFVHRVINCTGPEADFRKKRHPLIVSLMEQGLVRPDDLGMGIEATSSGAVLDAHQEPSTTLYTLGPTLKGGLWETTAVPELRVQAAARAARLLLNH